MPIYAYVMMVFGNMCEKKGGRCAQVARMAPMIKGAALVPLRS